MLIASAEVGASQVCRAVGALKEVDIQPVPIPMRFPHIARIV